VDEDVDDRGTDVTTVIDKGDHSVGHGDRADDQGDDHGSQGGLGSLVALLREREERIDELTTIVVDRTEAATVWQARAEFLAAQLDLAQTEIKALKAPQEVQNGTLDAPGSMQGPKPSTERSRLPWRSWAVYGVGIISVIALVIGLVALLTGR